ncbi:hypothetical protein DV737_g5115, partial [Chaetothyriales sp. CBS 132003]
MDVKSNPKDSMKSTWRRGDRTNWGFGHWLTDILDTYPDFLDKEVPVHSKKDPVPYVTEWRLHCWIMTHTLVPIALHHAFICLTGYNLHPVAAFLFYSYALMASSVRELHQLRDFGLVYGYLDGDAHARDGIPDVGVGKVMREALSTLNFRLLMAIIFTYRSNLPPSTLSWVLLPVEIGLYSVILDFWFYWYHRFMHDVGSLWKYHRTHHLTKHPNSLLAGYADTEQEIMDVLGIPLMTYCTLRLLGFPMGFYEWYICHQYILFAEIAGHSGLRFALVVPSTLSWMLRLFNAELLVEDHDLHHRKGWRKSYNYGKQTRLWDRIFGTCTDRIECLKDNIDYKNTVKFPLY